MSTTAGPSLWAWLVVLALLVCSGSGTAGAPVPAGVSLPGGVGQAWSASVLEQTQRRLRARPERHALHERWERYESAAAAQVSDPVRLKGETLVYLRRSVLDAQGQLVVRAGLRGRETVVVDEATLKRRTGQPHRMLQVLPSPDGRRAALLLQVGAAPAPALRVLELASGRALGADVERVPTGGASWLPDSSGLLVMQGADPGAPRGDALQALFVSLGMGQRGPGGPGGPGRPGNHRVVLHAGRDLGLQPAEWPALQVQPDGRVLLSARHAVTGHLQVWWHADVAALARGRGDWKRLAGAPDAITALVLRGDRYFALSEAGAPTRRLVSGLLAPTAGPEAAAAEWLPPGDIVLTSLAVAADGLYLAARAGAGRHLLLRRSHRAEAVFEEINLPLLGAFSLGAHSAHVEAEGLLLGVDSWTRRRQILRVGADGRAANTGLQGQGPYDAPGELLAMESPVEGAPGLTLTLVHQASTLPDGERPVLLQVLADTPGQAGADERMFNSALQVWLDLGGLLAVVHPVGSIEERGLQVVAAAMSLFKQRWTRPQRLALAGTGDAAAVAALAAIEQPTQFAALIVDEGAWAALQQRPALLQWGALASHVGAEAPVLLQPADAAPGQARERALDRLGFLLQRLQWELPGRRP